MHNTAARVQGYGSGIQLPLDTERSTFREGNHSYPLFIHSYLLTQLHSSIARPHSLARSLTHQHRHALPARPVDSDREHFVVPVLGHNRVRPLRMALGVVARRLERLVERMRVVRLPVAHRAELQHTERVRLVDEPRAAVAA